MTYQQLDAITSELTPLLDQRREEIRHQRRGTDRSRNRGAGAKDKLGTANRVLAAILYQRRIGTQELLARLFGVDRSTITLAVTEVRPLLEQQDRPIIAATASFRTPKDVAAHLDDAHAKIKTAC